MANEKKTLAKKGLNKRKEETSTISARWLPVVRSWYGRRRSTAHYDRVQYLNYDRPL
jgi:hypothetical protein